MTPAFLSRNFAAFLAASIFFCVSTATAAGQWKTDFEAAEAESRRTGKPLLVHFYADWCGPCRQMEQHTLHRPEVQRLLSKEVIGIKINADNRPDLVRRFGVSSLPSDVVVDAGGKVAQRSSGFMPANSYIASISPIARRAAAAFAPKRRQPNQTPKPTPPAATPSTPVESTPAPVMVVSTRPPMLRGYSPVALHKTREWIKGKPEFTARYRGQLYRMASAEEKAAFEQNPRRYTPRLLGCDAIVFNKADRAVMGKLDYAAFYGEELYLFESDANRRLFKTSPDRYISTRVVRIEDIETVIR